MLNAQLNLISIVFSLHFVLNFYVSTVPYVEIKPGQFPYLVIITSPVTTKLGQVNPLGVLLTNRWILVDTLSASVLQDLLKEYAYPGLKGYYPSESERESSLMFPLQRVLNATNATQYIDKDGFQFMGNFSFSLLQLKSPVPYRFGLYPISMSNGPFVTSEVFHIGLAVNSRPVINHSKIKMKSWLQCHHDYFNQAQYESGYFTQYRTNICSEAIINSSNETQITQGPYIVKGFTPQQDKLVGLHALDLFIADHTKVSVAVDIGLLRHHIETLMITPE